LGKGYGTNYGAIGEYIGCMLPHLIAWVEFPFLTLFINIFGLGFYEDSTPIAIHIN
jgi:hypothetical protein